MEGILITLLMFSIPIAAVLIDKRTKAGRSVPQVNAEPIDFSEDLQAEEEGVKAVVRKEAARREGGGIAAQTAAAQRSAAPGGEGIRTISGHGPELKPALDPECPAKPEERSTKRPAKPNPTAEEILRDRKKLILYSEILKPKFDEGC